MPRDPRTRGRLVWRETEIFLVDGPDMERVIDERRPLGSFLCIEEEGERRYTAVDNETGDAFTESFRTEEAAKLWLAGFLLAPDEAHDVDDFLTEARVVP